MRVRGLFSSGWQTWTRGAAAAGGVNVAGRGLIRRGAQTSAHATEHGRPKGRSTAATAIFFGVPVAVTFSLGVWQVRRLERKRNLIAERERTLALEPLDESALEDEAHEYRLVTLQGVLQHEKEMLIGPRSAPSGAPPAALQWGGSSGYLVATPLRTDQGRTVIVVRGWVPVRLTDRARRAEPAVSTLPFLTDGRGEGKLLTYEDTEQEHRVTFAGVLRTADEKNRFMPANNAASGDWFYVDTREMLSSIDVPLDENEVPPYVELVSPLPTSGWPFPRSMDEHLTFRTPPSGHITYATTWFGLSLALAFLSRGRVRASASARNL